MKKQTKTADSHKILLTVKKRDVVGKKVRALRRQNIIPANIFGEDFASTAIAVPYKEFTTVFRKSGATQIVYLALDSEEIPVLVQHVQYHPVSDAILHIDFRKVNLKKKIETEVPVKLVGTSPAVSANKGVLIQISNALMVEAYPDAIPTAIEIDISPLAELNDEIRLENLPSSERYVFKEEAKKEIVRITAHKEESVESQVKAPETVEVTTEKKEEAPAEGGKGEKGEKAGKTAPPAEKTEVKKEEKK